MPLIEIFRADLRGDSLSQIIRVQSGSTEKPKDFGRKNAQANHEYTAILLPRRKPLSIQAPFFQTSGRRFSSYYQVSLRRS